MAAHCQHASQRQSSMVEADTVEAFEKSQGFQFWCLMQSDFIVLMEPVNNEGLLVRVILVPSNPHMW